MEDKIYSIIYNNKKIDNYIRKALIDKFYVDEVKSNLALELFGIYSRKKTITKGKENEYLIEALNCCTDDYIDYRLLYRLKQIIYNRNDIIKNEKEQPVDDFNPYLNDMEQIIENDENKEEIDLINIHMFTDKIIKKIGNRKREEIGCLYLLLTYTMDWKAKQIKEYLVKNNYINKDDKIAFFYIKNRTISSMIEYLERETTYNTKAIKSRMKAKRSLSVLIKNNRDDYSKYLTTYKRYMIKIGLKEHQITEAFKILENKDYIEFNRYIQSFPNINNIELKEIIKYIVK